MCCWNLTLDYWEVTLNAFVYSYCFCVGRCSLKSARSAVRKKDGQEVGQGKHKLELQGWAGNPEDEMEPTWVSHGFQVSNLNEVTDLQGQLAPFTERKRHLAQEWEKLKGSSIFCRSCGLVVVNCLLWLTCI